MAMRSVNAAARSGEIQFDTGAGSEGSEVTIRREMSRTMSRMDRRRAKASELLFFSCVVLLLVKGVDRWERR